MIFNPLFIDSEAKQINPVGFGKAKSSYLFRDIINVVQNSQLPREFNSSSILTNILNDVKGLTKTSKDAKSKIDDQLNALLQKLNISGGFRIGNGEYLDTNNVNDSTVILGSAEKINNVLTETLTKLENEFDMSVQLPGNEGSLSDKHNGHLQKLLEHIQNKLVTGNPVAIQINQNNSEDTFTLKIEQIDSNIVPISSTDLSNKMFSITLLHGPSIKKSDFSIDKESPNYKNPSSQVEKELINKLVKEIDKTGKNNSLDPGHSDGQKTQALTVKLGNPSAEVKSAVSKITGDIVKTKIVDNTQNQQDSENNISQNKISTSNVQVEKEQSNKLVDEIKITSKEAKPIESFSKNEAGKIKTELADTKEIQQVSGNRDSGNKLNLSQVKYTTNESANSNNANLVGKASSEKVSEKEVPMESEFGNAAKETKSSNEILNTKNKIISEKEFAATSNKTINNKINATNSIKDSASVNNSTDSTSVKPLIEKSTENISKSVSTKETNEFKNNDIIDKKYVNTSNTKQLVDDRISAEKDSKSSLYQKNDVSLNAVKQTDIPQKELQSKISPVINKENATQEKINIQHIENEKISTHQIKDSSRSSKSTFEKIEQQQIKNHDSVDANPKITESKHNKLETVVIDLNTKDVKNVDEMDRSLRKTFLQDIQQLTHAKKSSYDNLINKLAKSSYELDSPVEHLKDSLLSADEGLFVSSRKTESLKMLDDVVRTDFVNKDNSTLKSISGNSYSHNSDEHDADKGNNAKNNFNNTVEINSKKSGANEIENAKSNENIKTSDNHEKATKKATDNTVEMNETKNSHSFQTHTTVKETLPNTSLGTNTATVKVNVKEQLQPELNTKLINEISDMAISDKKDKVIINLEPASLGKIKIAIEIMENKINAQLKVENQAAKEMLQNQTEFLKDSLSQNGLQLNSLNISLQNSENKNGKTEREKRKESSNEKVEIKEKPANGNSSKTMGYNTYEFIA